MNHRTIRRVAFELLIALTIANAASNAPADDLHPAIKQAEARAVEPPEGGLRLFNGKDLDGLTTWLKDTRHEDPRNVFTVTDDRLLHISGDGLGYIRTNRDYKNYHMVVEFKWGDKVWGARTEKTKDSGALVHCVGPDGGYTGTWMTSIEAQIIEGGYGDFILVAGKDENDQPIPIALTAETTKDRDGETVWMKGGEVRTLNRGRINWFGRDPDWKDVLGFRGKHDVDDPAGWNRLEVICDGSRITNIFNGKIVNEGYDAIPKAGKILLQAELAEVYFRRWELWPLGKAPKFD